MARTKTTAGDRSVVHSRSGELVALLVYALVGAAASTLLIAVLEMKGVLTSPPLVDVAQAEAQAEARACPLTASPADCDACMLEKCEVQCSACAANPSCLRLFACLMDCGDAACEALCSRSEPEGRADLAAFVGERGCLPRMCLASCP